MTNFGFHPAMEEAGIEVAITRSATATCSTRCARDWTLGGEQSGHIIATDFIATGDGIAAALLTMRRSAGAPGRRAAMDKLPQRLVNVRVRDREASPGPRASTQAVRARPRRSRAAAACSCAPPAPSRWCG